MRNLLITAVCLGALAPSLAAAAPTDEELKARKAELDKKLKGQGFTVLVEAPFVVVGDEGPVAVKNRATGFLRWTVKLLEKDYFPKQPDKIIEVWLFGNEKTYRAGAKKYFNDEPDTPYGYYSPEKNALIMNVSGLGTLSHELVHPYMEANFPDVPSWFNEGLASLYEHPGERKGHIIGHVNWRLPNLKKEIQAGTLPSLVKLVQTGREDFYNADWDAYAQARYLMYYLQEKGLLRTFYKELRAHLKDDPSGYKTLVSVLGDPDMAAFKAEWEAWVAAIVPP